MSLLDSLLWGTKLGGISQKASPAPPASPKCSAPEAANDRIWRDGKDAYGWGFAIALELICKTNAPEGLIVWLETRAPDLYLKLTRDLPDQISDAWARRVPLPLFEEKCAHLVETYHLATDLYRATAEARRRKR